MWVRCLFIYSKQNDQPLYTTSIMHANMANSYPFRHPLGALCDIYVMIGMGVAVLGVLVVVGAWGLRAYWE